MKSPALGIHTNVPPFLSGGGEMGQLIREYSWSTTSIGSIDNWPQSLRTTLSIILNSKFPMFLFWGTDLLCFYNDAYRPSLGNNGKHPYALGKPAETVWPEIWVIKPLIDQVLSGGEATWNEDQLIPIYRNGKIENVYWTFSYSPVIGESGRSAGVFVTCIETTQKVTYIKYIEENKNKLQDAIASKKIEESEEQLRIALEGGELGTYDFYPQTGKLIWSAKSKELFGLPPDAEVNYNTYITGFHPDDKDRAEAVAQKAMQPENGGLYENEYRTIGINDGKLRWLRSKGKVSFNNEGKPIRFSGVFQDITRQKDILASLQIQSLVLQRMDEGVSISDENGCIVHTNPAEDKMFGYEASELIGRNVTVQNAYPPEENEKIVTSVIDELKIKGFWSGEWHNRKKNGDGFYTYSYITSILVDGKTMFVCVQRDITEEKKREEALKAAKEQLELTFRNIPSGIYHFDKEGKIIYLNERGAILLGYASVEKVLEEKDVSQLKKKLDEAFEVLNEWGKPLQFNEYSSAITFKTGKPAEVVSQFINRKTGVSFWLLSISSPLYDDKGELLMVLTSSTNITLQKTAEDALRYRKALLEAHNEASLDGILLVDAKGKIISYNQCFVEIWNMPQEIVDAKDDEAALSFAMSQLVNPQQFIEKVKYLYQHPTETSIDELEYKDGKIVERHGYPVVGEDGTYYAWSWTFRDVTRQRRIEKEIKQSEEKFRTLSNSISQLAWMADGDGWIYWYNERWYNYTGTTLEEMQGWGWQKVHHPAHVDRVIAYAKEAWQKDKPYELTFPLRRYDGEYRWFLTRVYPVKNEEGKVVQWIGTNTDINQQLETETALKAAKEQLELTFRNVPSAIYHFDKNGKIIYLNEKGARQMGYETVKDVLAEKDVFQFRKKLDETFEVLDESGTPLPVDKSSAALAFKTGKPSEIVAEFINRKTGSSFWLLSKSAPLYDEKGELSIVLTTSTDITIQKTAEDSLRYRKALLEAHNEASFDGILLVDAKGKIISYNHRFVEMWNMPQEIVDAKDGEAALSFAMSQLVNPQQFIEKVKWVYDNPTETSIDELEYKDGKIIERQGYPVIGEDGTYYAWSWTFKDVTRQKIYEKTIKESEENFRQLANFVPHIVWTAKPDGYLDYYNKRWYEYTDFEEGYGDQSWVPILHPDDVQLCIDSWYDSVQTGKPYQIEYRFKDKEHGGYRWFLGKALPIRNEEGVITKWFGTCTDIHDQKTIEEKLEALVNERTNELQRSNENLQQFAHVASHDLKEPVRKIKTFTTRLLEEMNETLNEKGKLYLSKVLGAADRMFTMIDGVLTYSTFNASEQISEMLDLNEVLKTIETDLEVIIQEKHAIIHYKDLPTLEGAPILIYQLFYNLVNNSLKFAKTGEAPLIFIISEIVYNQNRAFAQIVIRDNGIGFEQNQSKKIFNTFARLNSKDKYEGTGLGLALCKKIVQRHHGTIEASGQVDKEATFTITLPLKQKEKLI